MRFTIHFLFIRNSSNTKDIIYFINIIYKGRIFIDRCVVYPEVSMGVIFISLTRFLRCGNKEGIISFFQFGCWSSMLHIFNTNVFITSIVMVGSFMRSFFRLCKTHHSITSQVGVGGISIVIFCFLLISYQIESPLATVKNIYNLF